MGNQPTAQRERTGDAVGHPRTSQTKPSDFRDLSRPGLCRWSALQLIDLKMASTDPTLAKLLHLNTQWAQAVGEADPGFFEAASKGQSPQVSLHLSSFLFDIAQYPFPVFTWRAYADDPRALFPFRLAFDSCCGLAVRIRGSQSRLLRDPSPARFSSTGISPSTSDQRFLLPIH